MNFRLMKKQTEVFAHITSCGIFPVYSGNNKRLPLLPVPPSIPLLPPLFIRKIYETNFCPGFSTMYANPSTWPGLKTKIVYQPFHLIFKRVSQRVGTSLIVEANHYSEKYRGFTMVALFNCFYGQFSNFFGNVK